MNIIGQANVDPARLRTVLNKVPSQLTTADRETLVDAYTLYGELTGIGNLYPFAQACKETAYFSSERWVQSKNPAGLGATNDGAWGNTFASIAEAIFAQYAHLMAYALPSNPTPLQKAIASADPRYAALVKKNWVGSAPRWQDLNGKWAYPGVGYGESIVVLGSTFRQ